MSEDLYLEQLKLGPMENFVYIIGSKSTREVALIDPAWENRSFVYNISNKRT